MLMAANPFDHVLDTSHWHLLEEMSIGFRLPHPFTKFMVIELVAAGLILAIFIPVSRRISSGEPPRGYFWNAFESLLTFIRDRVARPNIGDHDADAFVPFLWTQFLFILFCNLLGMFPYLASPTASITVTGVLALCTGGVIHGGAIAKMGLGHYLKSYVPHIEVPFGMGYMLIPMIVAIEVVGVLIKMFVLAVRLFANMLAGHTVLAVILLFIVMAQNSPWFLFWPITIGSIVGVTALSLLELFVAFLQAFIFTFLTSLFLGMTLHPQH
jgi:F-type H+-transporting ATPase subunit a